MIHFGHLIGFGQRKESYQSNGGAILKLFGNQLNWMSLPIILMVDGSGFFCGKLILAEGFVVQFVRRRN